MPALLAPTVLLAHAGHVHEAGGPTLAYGLLAAVPFLLGTLFLRARQATTWNVVLFSAAAGFIHALVTPEHFEEGLAVGLFMLAVTVAQMAVVVAGLNRPSRALWAATAAVNVGVLAIWLLSRTTGLPVGPTAGSVEPMGFLDMTCAVYEAALVVGCVTLARGNATAQHLRLAL